MQQVLHLDFETKSAVDLKKAGADVYARHWSTEIMCMAWALGEGSVELFHRNTEPITLPHAPIDHVKAGGTVVAHNAAFELALWNHVLVPRYGWPELHPTQTQCTMAMAYAMSLPGSLDDASAAVGIEQKKDMQGRRVMLQLSKPKEEHACPVCEGVGYTPWAVSCYGAEPAATTCRSCQGRGRVYEWHEDAQKFERLYEYCKQDVEVERALHKRLMSLSQDERAVWLLDQKINQRGIRVDLKSAETAIRLVEFEKTRLDREMRKVTGNQVGTCSAVGQLTDWLRFRGVELESVAKQDVVDLLAMENLPDDCRRALELRQEAAKSSTAKLEAMIQGVCGDGRIRGTMQYHGAGTGRWAGRRLQVHNFPRPTFSQDAIDDVFRILGSVSDA